MDQTERIEDVARLFEAAGVLILLVGAAWVALRTVAELIRGRPVYENVRRDFGRTLLLSLEVLVAADVITTVAVETTLESVTALGILVLVRTVLSISLDAEIDGIVPWRKAAFERKNPSDS